MVMGDGSEFVGEDRKSEFDTDRKRVEDSKKQNGERRLSSKHKYLKWQQRKYWKWLAEQIALSVHSFSQFTPVWKIHRKL